MNFPIDHMYRLSDRGGAGLSCDAQGVALGSAELARVHLDEGGIRRCEDARRASSRRCLKPPTDLNRTGSFSAFIVA
jgi:hypothetical protein